jgi:hypothetical protein
MDAFEFHYNSPRFRAIKKWYRALKISSELTSSFFSLSHFYSFHANLYLFYCFVRFISSFFLVFSTHTGSVCHPWIVNETRIYFKMSTKLHNLCDMLDAVYVCTSMWIRLGMSRCFLYSRCEAQNCVFHSCPFQPPTVVSWMTLYERISIVSYIFHLFSYSLVFILFLAFFYFCSDISENLW